MSCIEAENIDRSTYMGLKSRLRDKRPDDKRDGYERVEGIHPRCGGFCTIVSEWGNDKPRQHSVIKPHSICEPVNCMGRGSRCKCSGSVHPLPSVKLDCNKVT